MTGCGLVRTRPHPHKTCFCKQESMLSSQPTRLPQSLQLRGGRSLNHGVSDCLYRSVPPALDLDPEYLVPTIPGTPHGTTSSKSPRWPEPASPRDCPRPVALAVNRGSGMGLPASTSPCSCAPRHCRNCIGTHLRQEGRKRQGRRSYERPLVRLACLMKMTRAGQRAPAHITHHHSCRRRRMHWAGLAGQAGRSAHTAAQGCRGDLAQMLSPSRSRLVH